MLNNIGFIGGGRITRIFLEAILRKTELPDNITITEVNSDAASVLKKYGIINIENELKESLNQKYIFISLHPPSIKNLIPDLKGKINKDSIIISLAPKLPVKWFKENLGDDIKVVRCIPNAPSIVNKGFNPLTFSDNITPDEKAAIIEFFDLFGRTEIVEENKLEVYAVISAMGPTYLWFQLYELKNIAENMGLPEEEACTAVQNMAEGTIATMFSDLQCSEVLDLIPVKPLGEYEEVIKECYRKSLNSIYEKIRIN
jgi:pyrroline-5-carboxylate reductase